MLHKYTGGLYHLKPLVTRGLIIKEEEGDGPIRPRLPSTPSVVPGVGRGLADLDEEYIEGVGRLGTCTVGKSEIGRPCSVKELVLAAQREAVLRGL